jgi:hypothetical protein
MWCPTRTHSWIVERAVGALKHPSNQSYQKARPFRELIVQQTTIGPSESSQADSYGENTCHFKKAIVLV